MKFNAMLPIKNPAPDREQQARTSNI